MRPLVDTLLVARFEVLRARRTTRILLMLLLYVVAMAVAALIFGSVVWSMEMMLADTLGAPITSRPGAPLDRLQEGEDYRRMLRGLVSDPDLVDVVMGYPLLATFHLWASLIFVPFFAATSAAESVSADLATRTIRFEVVRTGRLELVTGRFVGQIGLVGLATLVSVFGTWAVGVFYFVNQDPWTLLVALCWFSLRAWGFAVPFVGLGVAASQLGTSVNLARILALLGTAGTWVLFWWSRFWTGPWEILADALHQVLPQAWIHGLWYPAPTWMLSCLVCCGVGYVLVALGYVRFAGRDL